MVKPLTLTITVDVTPFVEAMNRIRESFHEITQIIARMRQRTAARAELASHSFRPDYDLGCSLCPLTAEEHT